MASEKIHLKVTTDAKGASKDINKLSGGTKQATKETTLLSAAMGGVKKAMIAIKATGKIMFGSLKAGLISTGIGAFVVIIGSLLSYFMNTKAGAEKLEQAFAAVGAAIAVITDRISAIGGAIVKVFKGDFKGAVEDVKGAMVGIGDEIIAEANAAMRLKAELQELADMTREFNIEKAQTRQEIAKALLISDDETKSNQERLVALKQALIIEEQTTQKELALQRRRVAAIEEEVALGESLAEDLDKLNAEKIRLIDLETSSIKIKRKVQTEVNAFEIAIAAEAKARRNKRKKAADLEAKAELKRLDDIAKATQKLIDIENKRVDKLAADSAKLLDDFATSQLDKEAQEEQAINRKYERIIEGRRALGEDVSGLEEAQQSELDAISDKHGDIRLKTAEDKAKAEVALEQQKIAAVAGTIGAVASLAGEGTEAWKALKTAEALMGIATGAQQAYNATVGIPYVGPILAPIQAGMAVVAGMKQVQTIQSTPIPEAKARGGYVRGYGSGTSDSIPARLSRGEVVINAKSARRFRPLLSNINVAGGGIGFARGGATTPDMGRAMDLMTDQSIKAYVITDEMTNSQSRLSKIRRKANV